MNRMAKKFGEQGLGSYQCPFCGWWHFGHVPKMEGISQRKEIE